MIVGSIIEDRKIESRVALTPENVKKFFGLGFKVLIEKKSTAPNSAKVSIATRERPATIAGLAAGKINE